jgi:hypothetical protein
MVLKLGLLTLREEQTMMAFESRVLSKIFGPMTDEVKGRWRKLHNEELRDLYSLPITITRSSLRSVWQETYSTAALPVEVTLNHNCPGQNSVRFAAL